MGEAFSLKPTVTYRIWPQLVFDSLLNSKKKQNQKNKLSGLMGSLATVCGKDVVTLVTEGNWNKEVVHSKAIFVRVDDNSQGFCWMESKRWVLELIPCKTIQEDALTSIYQVATGWTVSPCYGRGCTLCVDDRNRYVCVPENWWLLITCLVAYRSPLVIWCLEGLCGSVYLCSAVARCFAARSVNDRVCLASGWDKEEIIEAAGFLAAVVMRYGYRKW